LSGDGVTKVPGSLLFQFSVRGKNGALTDGAAIGEVLPGDPYIASEGPVASHKNVTEGLVHLGEKGLDFPFGLL
jgi:hypothetical protein